MKTTKSSCSVKKIVFVILVFYKLLNYSDVNAQCVVIINDVRGSYIKSFEPKPIVTGKKYKIETSFFYNQETNEKYIAFYNLTDEKSRINDTITLVLRNGQELHLQNSHKYPIEINGEDISFYSLNENDVLLLSNNSLDKIEFNRDPINTHKIYFNKNIFIEQIKCLKIIKNYSNTELNDKAIEERKKQSLALSKKPETLQATLDYINQSKYNQATTRKPYFSSSDKEHLVGTESYNGVLDLKELQKERREEETKKQVLYISLSILGGVLIYLIFKKLI